MKHNLVEGTSSAPQVVVKVGGVEGLDFAAIARDAAVLISKGQPLVLVHGGSAEANQLGSALGTPPRFITAPSGFTSRYTDIRTLEIFVMAVNGKVNTTLVEELLRAGVNAFGLSGVDGRLITAERKSAVRSIENGKQVIIRDDYTGKISSVDASLVKILLRGGYTPVIAPLAIDPTSQVLNVDADRAAAMVAAALKAETLVFLTAVPGLMRSFPDEDTLIHQLGRANLASAMEYAQGRMKKKLLGAEEALQSGVSQVVIADGRIENPISRALAGKGTSIN
jgi:acetylglutamate/LysW-gamma-L-alpha-aminoadipate kinase